MEVQGAPVFSGSVAEIYDSHLVPLIFEPYATDLARRVAARQPRAVLETAAGTGVVTRELAPLLPPGAAYVVSDLNAPMLGQAQARHGPDGRLDWQVADATALPFEDARFDAVLCQFGVMFFPDRPKGYAEARRVLRPGGAFLFNTWDRIGANEFPDVVMQALRTVFADDAPSFMSRIPHGYHDTDQIAADLRAGGFERFGIETIEVTSTGPSAHDVAVAFCQGTPMRAEIEGRAGPGLERATEAARAALAARYGDGPISGKIRAHVVTARAP